MILLNFCAMLFVKNEPGLLSNPGFHRTTATLSALLHSMDSNGMKIFIEHAWIVAHIPWQRYENGRYERITSKTVENPKDPFGGRVPEIRQRRITMHVKGFVYGLTTDKLNGPYSEHKEEALNCFKNDFPSRKKRIVRMQHGDGDEGQSWRPSGDNKRSWRPSGADEGQTWQSWQSSGDYRGSWHSGNWRKKKGRYG